MAKNMDDFLDANEPEEVVAAAETPIVEGAPEVEEPEAPEPEAEEPEAQEPELKQVPISVVQGVRREKEDWKGKALTLEGDMKALAAKLEAIEAARAAPAEPEAPPVFIGEMPNPAEDPAGFQKWNDDRIWNITLNLSEAALRRQHGDEAVNAKLNVFKAAVKQNPALIAAMRSQADPYDFVFKQAMRIEAMNEIGEDPSAYRAKIEADIRAKLEAEYAANAPMAAAPVRLPASLGTARSAAPRATLDEVPEFDSLFGKRKKA